MKVKELQIWELTTPNEHEMTHSFQYVHVVYDNCKAWGSYYENPGPTSMTIDDGFAMETWEDDPIIITENEIVISGGLKHPEPKTKDAFGEWRLLFDAS